MNKIIFIFSFQLFCNLPAFAGFSSSADVVLDCISEDPNYFSMDTPLKLTLYSFPHLGDDDRVAVYYTFKDGVTSAWMSKRDGSYYRDSAKIGGGQFSLVHEAGETYIFNVRGKKPSLLSQTLMWLPNYKVTQNENEFTDVALICVPYSREH